MHIGYLLHILLLQPVAIQDLWCVAAKDMLLEYIAKVKLPNRYIYIIIFISIICIYKYKNEMKGDEMMVTRQSLLQW